MVRLGMDDVRAKTMVAGTVSKDERARLSQAKDGPSVLDVQEPFDRAWRRVGLALDRVGFTVEDRDRSQGLYFVRYVDPEIDVLTKKTDQGFLDKLAFWKSNKPDVSKNAQFRIHVKSEGSSSSVKVLTREGGTDTSETSRKILGLLLDQLK
jgi:outer membrane protein assembly factor BamC